ncbi:FtsQ-type POTRA domain-containing protein [Rhodococcus spelaei]|uniref:FtsQ-type POTRA domain-containing protein n=1 Tax=Rhodococcus spelaei TaxID=2546320 RepID=A0A541BMQ0_9NOCA|nr:FtsQ-type POTRA domain-containing protein [Rhodococcus spelaei]TQF73599.1 FtsQ-type POTRA domain-containing protein [Rhodococcus spelaei]
MSADRRSGRSERAGRPGRAGAERSARPGTRRQARPDQAREARVDEPGQGAERDRDGRQDQRRPADSAAKAGPAPKKSRRTRRPKVRRVRNRKPILLTALAVVVVVGLGVAAWFTPVLSARKITVVGNVGVSSDEILSALAVPVGKPLLRIDTGAAAQRVASIAKVDHARVERAYPSTVRVTVVERAPAVFYDAPEGTHLMDASGVAYAIEPAPPGVPRLKTEHPGRDDPATVDALAAVTALPPELRGQVTEVAVGSLDDIRLALTDDRQLIWGSAANSARKAAIAPPLLSQPGKVYDVSSPDLPTIR